MLTLAKSALTYDNILEIIGRPILLKKFLKILQFFNNIFVSLYCLLKNAVNVNEIFSLLCISTEHCKYFSKNETLRISFGVFLINFLAISYKISAKLKFQYTKLTLALTNSISKFPYKIIPFKLSIAQQYKLKSFVFYWQIDIINWCFS